MERLFRSKALSALLLTALIVVFSLGAWAQGAGDLNGTVTDPTGAVLAKVAVKVTNDATGVVRTTETTSAGIFNFTALPSGPYTLSVTATGFRPVTVKGIVISVAAAVTHDIKMEVGGSTEVVNVEAGAEMVQTTESSVSQLIDSNVWKQMPLETRSANTFINLVAGAVPDAQAGSTRGAAVNGARGGTGNYMVDGMDNNDQGQGGRGQLGNDPGGMATSISPDAIQEYRVITNSFSAEYGKAGGFVTDTVLKSGTNQLHGALYEYNRVQALAANGYFSNRQGLKDSLVRNQFGGAIGGPIIKDKTFFFFNTEIHRMRQGNTISTRGTTQQFLDWVDSGQMATWMETDPAGACMQYTGATCPGAFTHSRTLGPIFKNLLTMKNENFPLATSAYGYEGEGFYTTGLTFPVPAYGDVFLTDPYHLNEYRIAGKFDQKISSTDELAFTYLEQHAESGDPYGGGGGAVGPPGINEGIGVTTGVSWNHSFTPTVLNVFKAGYLRHRSDFPAPDGTLGVPQILTTDEMGTGFGLYAGLPQYFTDNQFQYQDSLSIMHGKHGFKVGAEYRRIRNGSSFYNDTFGSFNPWAVEDMVTDLYFTDELERAIGIPTADQVGSVYSASAAVVPSTGQRPVVYRGFRANEMAAYFQDDWRINSRFTVNMGLRFEYFGPPHNFQPNIDSNFYFGTTITPFTQLVGVDANGNPNPTNPYFPSNNPFYSSVSTGTFQVRNASIWNKDTNNFAPRLGFAWDMLGNQKLVMRAGAGINYDRIYNNVFENIRFNPPYFSDNQVGWAVGGTMGGLDTPGLYQVPFENNGQFATGFSAKPNPRHMDQNLVSPYYEQYHFGFQYEFAKGYVFEPEYIGTMGHKLVAYRNINTFDGRTVFGGTNIRATMINPNVGADNYRSNDYSSNYHGLQLTVRKSYSYGLQFNANYTYSKALDTISDTFNSRGHASVTDTMNIKNDYGPADFNMKHRFVTSLSYELPFMKQNRWLGGWVVNTILSIQSGVPFSPYDARSSYDLNKDGSFTDRIVPTVAPMDTVYSSIHIDPNFVTYFNKAQWQRYTCPADVNNGQWCNAPIDRNVMTGPGYANTDFSLSKKFRINERAGLQLQGNVFNVFNHVNFGLPNYNLGSANFGRITSADSMRITQLALRFDF